MWTHKLLKASSAYLATVSHSVNFVDPETGVHTQTIESCWARTKLKFKTMKGVSADALPSYLDPIYRNGAAPEVIHTGWFLS
jgi:hypothetical protein